MLMRSLICLQHENWDGTVMYIRDNGGKAAAGTIPFFVSVLIHDLNWSLDWIQDKERSGFAFEGMCWQKSKIPLDIWRAGDANSNLIESVHADVNREGVSCTLVGGVTKGHFFDTLKMKTLRVSKFEHMLKS